MHPPPLRIFIKYIFFKTNKIKKNISEINEDCFDKKKLNGK